jgi:alpha-galactosidase
LILLSLSFAFAQSIRLEELEISHITQGWGSPQKNKNIEGNDIFIKGIKYAHGLGTHALSRIVLKLDGKVTRFEAVAGITDEVEAGKGSIRFIICTDKDTLYKSDILRAESEPQKISINLKGLEKIFLIVTDAGDGIAYDHGVWANGQFFYSKKRPEIMEIPRYNEPKEILTPKPSKKPRINGAKIFAVRPGSPFLFTIPVTGERPINYSANGLPNGLKLDSETGQITGMIKDKGKYKVVLKAANSLGTAEREFMIICGEDIALTPHMGWNHWYVWENHVKEKHIRDAADAMVKTGMINHGYMYINIDDCWAIKPGSKDSSLSGEPRDKDGKINSNKRFPNMKELTDYIHSKGLKAGIYTSPGPLTCAGHIGAYQHEEADAQRFAEWGFDFLKYDWCSYRKMTGNDDLEGLKAPYKLMGDILKKQPRDIVYNLCQYGFGDVWKWGKEIGGNSWRTALDLGSSFEHIADALFRDGFDVYSKNELYKYGSPSGWNDPDYLLLGYLSNWKGQTELTSLTPNEQYTHFSLWCLLAAPLIFSGDMSRLDDFTLNILTNDEVIEVDQDPLGKPGKRITKDGNLEVWCKELEDGSRAVGLFNRGEKKEMVTVKWTDLNINGKQLVRDLWRQKNLGKFTNQFSAEVKRHGVILIKITPIKM